MLSIYLAFLPARVVWFGSCLTRVTKPQVESKRTRIRRYTMGYSKTWIAAAAALALATGACTAKVEEEGKMPDVEVSGGQVPKVDVDPANVEVGTDTHTVVTPTVNVTPADTTKH
jgi:hypothetical protein